MSAIVAHGIPGQQAPHYRGDWYVAGFEQEMEMIGNQRPGVTSRSGFGDDGAQTLEEIISILIILEDPLTFNTTTYDMVQSAGGVDARFSWHTNNNSKERFLKQRIISWASLNHP